MACCNIDTFYYQLVSGGNVIAFQGPTTSNTSTFNNLSAGSYTIYVYQDTTDLDPLNAAWCTSGGASINQPSAINITTTQTNLLCYGASSGSIVLSVGGGTIGPVGHSCRGYQVNWSGPNGSFGGDPTCSCTTGNPSGCVLEIPTTTSNISNSANRDTLSGLSAGTYTITVTDYNGCQKTIVRTITQPPQIIPTIIASIIPCNGYYGSITVSDLNASDGTPGSVGFNVSWSGQSAGNPNGVEISPSAITP